jgi:hypothetical protein
VISFNVPDQALRILTAQSRWAVSPLIFQRSPFW